MLRRLLYHPVVLQQIHRMRATSWSALHVLHLYRIQLLCTNSEVVDWWQCQACCFWAVPLTVLHCVLCRRSSSGLRSSRREDSKNWGTIPARTAIWLAAGSLLSPGSCEKQAFYWLFCLSGLNTQAVLPSLKMFRVLMEYKLKYKL